MQKGSLVFVTFSHLICYSTDSISLFPLDSWNIQWLFLVGYNSILLYIFVDLLLGLYLLLICGSIYGIIEAWFESVRLNWAVIYGKYAGWLLSLFRVTSNEN